MTVAEYTAYERAMGAHILESGGVYWRRVRPLFYRPLLPYEPLDPAVVLPPPSAKWGGYQYVVSDSSHANGSLAFLMFGRVSAYGLESLEKKRRWEVRHALRHFTVRRLGRAAELVSAHPVFVEFQRRSGYRYRADRVDPVRYAQWAEAVFRHPKVIVMGAIAGDRIEAVAIGHVLGDTFIYGTFFATGAALRRHVASFMLHTIRTLAGAIPGVARVYVGLRKHHADSIDQFYLQRGCEVVVQPARCQLHPVARWCLKVFRPKLWEQLRGSMVGAMASTARHSPR